jgi:uncharacterized membrane protein
MGAIGACAHALLTAGWSDETVIALETLIILGAGAMLALAAAFIPAVGRLFLDRVRARTEAIQYAQTMFLERELFRTAERRAVLVVVCRFERMAVLVTDNGLAQYAPPAALAEIGRSAGPLAARGDFVPAFELAFEALRSLLRAHGYTASASAANEIDDEVVMGRDA